MEPQREWFEKDYYAVLGVANDAPEREIKRAYKALARKLHPDQNPGDVAAEDRFKDVAAAYDVLGDGEKRKAYDDVRRMVASGHGPGGFPGGAGGFSTFDFSDFAADDVSGGFGDLFGGLFAGGRGARGRRPRGGAQKGRDLETELHLNFDDAARGVTTTVRFTADSVCSSCHGSGARAGTSPEPCGVCNGTGNTSVNQGPFSFSQVCGNCAGRGSVINDPCPTCRGRGVEARSREVKVRIPAGVADGQRIRVKDRGGAGTSGGPPGDLYVVVHVRAHDQFGRKGNDLTVRRVIPYSTAVLGGSLDVPTLDGGNVTIKIPAGTPIGKTFRVPGKGIAPVAGSPGALLVTVDVEVPTSLTDAQRRSVEAVAVAFGEPIAREPRDEKRRVVDEGRVDGAA
jgi:molecular chaperone DnaJ